VQLPLEGHSSQIDVHRRISGRRRGSAVHETTSGYRPARCRPTKVRPPPPSMGIGRRAAPGRPRDDELFPSCSLSPNFSPTAVAIRALGVQIERRPWRGNRERTWILGGEEADWGRVMAADWGREVAAWFVLSTNEGDPNERPLLPPTVGPART
jgi:hypothetical protein